jgi:hypothetical protein
MENNDIISSKKEVLMNFDKELKLIIKQLIQFLMNFGRNSLSLSPVNGSMLQFRT